MHLDIAKIRSDARLTEAEFCKAINDHLSTYSRDYPFDEHFLHKFEQGAEIDPGRRAAVERAVREVFPTQLAFRKARRNWRFGQPSRKIIRLAIIVVLLAMTTGFFYVFPEHPALGALTAALGVVIPLLDYINDKK